MGPDLTKFRIQSAAMAPWGGEWTTVVQNPLEWNG
jgi:hypothetical protein